MKSGNPLIFQVISRPRDRQDDGKLANLALVSGDAVFSTSKKGLEGCVVKPKSRKSLKTEDHITKVRDGGRNNWKTIAPLRNLLANFETRRLASA